MVLKIINAHDAKPGTNIMIEGSVYTVKKVDISKTGKHGASKCRIELEDIVSGQKKIVAVPGHERFDVPMIDKRKGQVLSVGDRASVMDIESFETLDMDVPEELKAEIDTNSSVEYWDIEGRKIIKRKI
ncbi:MAG: translation initiation factor IF-5A [Candidatus Pacearchaeota archaeon]|nr:translation initiation factor IF-5A [Candidatus Pacearchaeota archaeon]